MIKKMLFVLIFLNSVSYGQIKQKTGIDTFLTKFENNSKDVDYKIYIGPEDSPLYLLKKNSTLNLKHLLENQIHITSSITIVLKSLNTEYPHIYLQFAGMASGQCPNGYSGPYYIELWQGHYDLPDVERQAVRYCQKGKSGTIGLSIDQKGKPKIFCDENTKIIEEDQEIPD